MKKIQLVSLIVGLSVVLLSGCFGGAEKEAVKPAQQDKPVAVATEVKSDEKVKQEAVQQSEQPEAKPVEIQKNPKTGWNIYRDEEFGFEFEYPDKWFIENEGSGKSVSISNIQDATKKRYSQENRLNKKEMSGTFSCSDYNYYNASISLNEILTMQAEGEPAPTRKKQFLTINGGKAFFREEVLYKGEPLLDGSPNEEKSSVFRYNYLKGEKDRILCYFYMDFVGEKDADLIVMFHQIAKTFRFTEAKKPENP